MDIKKILFKNNTIDVEKALPDAIIYASKDGKIQWVNDEAADIFETSKMHLMTSKINDFIENSINLISSAVIMHKPVIVKFKDKEIYFDMTAKELENGYVLDLRYNNSAKIENKQQDEKTEIINREKNNFLLKLSNDLKSPIQSIVGFSQAMSDGLGGSMSEQQEKYIRIINKNSSDLMYFIAKLLELSQAESELKPSENKPFDMVNLINSVVRYNEQLYKGKDVKINVLPADNFKKTVNSNEDIVKNIVQDILEIMLKTIDIGDINISLVNPENEFIVSKNIKAGQYCLLSMSSASLLLSENDLDCLFDPYKIVDSTNRKNVLRAIVLSSVKHMVQSLGGITWVESKVLKNTTFYVLFPV